MIEFGEKIKRLREGKGMTQQTLADQLYVTRQAVSRWECGARYPELLMAKRIAEVLETSVDELLSGEEFVRDIEKEPILHRQGSNYMQTILYTMGAVSYLLIGICLTYSMFVWGIYDVFTVLGYGISFMAMASGIYFSVRNEISPRKTGVILCAEFLRAWFVFIGACTMTIFVGNGRITPHTWVSLACHAVEAVLIIRYFLGNCFIGNFFIENSSLGNSFKKKKRISPIPVYVIGVLMAAQGVLQFRFLFQDSFAFISSKEADEGLGALLTMMVIALGQFAIGVLTIYQAYVLDKKRKSLAKPEHGCYSFGENTG
ncbi:MAG: helix-turn-helix domain-containing protein [Lachnospiraceae bacterium]|nr:helix-turn-helix domain-containing protein [Lachnospiraceae bacterium]